MEKLFLSTNASVFIVSMSSISGVFGCAPLNSLCISVALFIANLIFSFVLLFFLNTSQKKEEVKIEYIKNIDNHIIFYVGFWFLGLGINSVYSLIFVIILFFAFSCATNLKYFNPAFLLMGYHFYEAQTAKGTSLFLIIKGRTIRNLSNIDFLKLKRLNDTIFIGRIERM